MRKNNTWNYIHRLVSAKDVNKAIPKFPKAPRSSAGRSEVVPGPGIICAFPNNRNPMGYDSNQKSNDTPRITPIPV